MRTFLKSLRQHLFKRKLIFKILVLLLVLMSIFFVFYNTRQDQDFIHRTDTVLHIHNQQLHTQVAKTGGEAGIGLSQHPYLRETEAMLFVFEHPGFYAFHMPNMNFPIDIIWLNKNREIVTIKHTARPEDYPEKYYPEKSAQFVVETVAGFADRYNLKNGDVFHWGEVN